MHSAAPRRAHPHHRPSPKIAMAGARVEIIAHNSNSTSHNAIGTTGGRTEAQVRFPQTPFAGALFPCRRRLC